jgi:hypothetical protein
MSNRAAEYRQLIEDVIEENAALKAKFGFDLVEKDEWQQLGGLVSNVLKNIKPKAAK